MWAIARSSFNIPFFQKGNDMEYSIKQKRHIFDHKILPLILEAPNLIKEGLIMSHNIESVYKILSRLGFNPEFTHDIFGRDYVMIGSHSVTRSLLCTVIIDEEDNFEEYNTFCKYINNLGYYISVISAPLFKFKDLEKFEAEMRAGIVPSMVNILIEPKYDAEVDVSQFEYMYHVTSEKYVQNILKKGLIPKSKSKISAHPDRIYLAVTKIDSAQLGKMFNDIAPGEGDVMLKVKVPKAPHFKYFIDPNAANAVYTYNNIHPSNIERIN